MSELLPTGTVTLLLADIEGSTRLWQTQPAQMAAAIALLDRTLADLVASHGGVRPIEQGEGDSFVVAFGRAADAVSCALQLQLSPLEPIALRIGLHTGDVQLRDDNNYVGATINRAGRLRDLAHGGQTLLSATTADMVLDQLSDGTWLIDCGSYQLRDLPRPEHISQLGHRDLPNNFPPLRAPTQSVAGRLPVQLDSFIGRRREIAEVLPILADNRLVTLIGGGGVGKSRLAVQVAAQLAPEGPDQVYYANLEPITDPNDVPGVIADALGFVDHTGHGTLDSLVRFLCRRRSLILLDNCEHLLDGAAAQIKALLQGCPELTLLATSREPMAVAGEVVWRVPTLSSDDAIAFFADRARLARRDFAVTDDNVELVSQICRRLNGMPLGLGLAAARVRSLSLPEIMAGLDDKIRLLTGGARTAPLRHQTLRASLDWSHELLSKPERILFRRLGVFVGGFDLETVQAVAGFGELPHYQVLDELTLLVDKSLVVADSTAGRTRYRRSEGIGQFAMEQLHEADETDTVRERHSDHYIAMAARLDSPGRSDYAELLDQAETEIDNLRAAFTWCRETYNWESAMALASSLQPLWLSRGHMREGRSWFESLLAKDLTDPHDIAPQVCARALADMAVLDIFLDAAASRQRAEEALAMAREIADPVLLARALTARGLTAGFNYEANEVQEYFAEAAQHARSTGDQWRLSQILSWQSNAAMVAGDAAAAYAIGSEGSAVADAIGDLVSSRQCRLSVAYARLWHGELARAAEEFAELVSDGSDTDLLTSLSLKGLGDALAYQGDVRGARAAAEAAIAGATEAGQYFAGLGYATLVLAALVEGDVEAAQEANEKAWLNLNAQPQTAHFWRAFKSQVLLASGDLAEARQCADEAVEATSGWHLALALTTRARVAMSQGEPEQAERDAYAALSCAAEVRAYNCVPAILESLARLAVDQENQSVAARLFGAAEAQRQRTGAVRFKVYDAVYESSVTALRTAMDEDQLLCAWADGAALSTEEAIAYPQRRRGERKRAASGWASLTRAELDVVRLVGEGLSNKDIAERLFVSPRTVQTHLTHVYTKLGNNSRVQLAQEAARHA
ncbi:helix-turn-helix transcriptional regulator [Mycobacterium vicinigordonae]|uniref:LuxR family transcriptional regulator n=1 Tax=Mycobacterium vicinigordonae TaxID=1719132 RepID=A0A7D6HWF1_9MYCO|nr:LuxR family transcriptional regulator [Mycobacterium vicinigordonae]QLL08493.1 LuxR family transcriptional regulator [Mycobacterium vicinigordonae]